MRPFGWLEDEQWVARAEEPQVGMGMMFPWNSQLHLSTLTQQVPVIPGAQAPIARTGAMRGSADPRAMERLAAAAGRGRLQAAMSLAAAYGEGVRVQVQVVGWGLEVERQWASRLRGVVAEVRGDGCPVDWARALAY